MSDYAPQRRAKSQTKSQCHAVRTWPRSPIGTLGESRGCFRDRPGRRRILAPPARWGQQRELLHRLGSPYCRQRGRLRRTSLPAPMRAYELRSREIAALRLVGFRIVQTCADTIGGRLGAGGYVQLWSSEKSSRFTRCEGEDLTAVPNGCSSGPRSSASRWIGSP